LTAFSVTGRGQFQFKRMPFGLHSAAGTFQALVDRLFKKTRFVWSTECERAFSEVKNAPILSCPDFNHPFTPQCDAYDIGIGAVLTQNFNGNERVICYLSRALSLTKRKYSTTEKECLRVIYAIKRLRCYLEGARFTVITDHYSLLWLNNLEDPLGRLGRWVMRLQAFDFNIVHRKGKDNVVPDCLSRAVTSNAEQIQPLDVGYVVEDEWIAAMIKKITDILLRYPNYRTRDGHVFKKVTCRDGDKDRRKDILRRYHDDATTRGHLRVYKTYSKISNNHTWPRMRADVCRYIRRCPVCASVKPEQKYPAGTMGSRPEIS
jgi:hypothetical protein